VGKSALTIQFVSHQFCQLYDPTIEDSYRKQILVDDRVCFLDILDTAGQEEYSAMKDQYMFFGQGFLLCYSITDRNSFIDLPGYRSTILKVKEDERFPMVIVANKSDLERDREVTREEAEDLARKLQLPLIETSAKSRINVDEAFFELIREMRNREPPSRVKEKKKGGCVVL